MSPMGVPKGLVCPQHWVLHMGCTWEAVGGTNNVQGSVGPLLVHLLTKPDALGARSLPMWAPSGR